MSKFFITTAIDYTNDVIHIGHAYQKIMSDVIARYHRLVGDKTFFLTGTDEHGGTSEQAAKKAGKSPKEFVDEISRKDKEQLDALAISYDRFIRTTDEDHKKIVHDFYLKVKAQGDIYKGEYSGYYCVGCESYKTESEIVNGKCILHPTRELEVVKEENYFFRWSKYAHFLGKHIEENPNFIKPKSQKKNMLGFLEQGIEDIAISRQKDKVSWGISVPDDPNHVVYVWFDALINYISGSPKLWPANLHVVGKDNVRWHALLWPAMLKSAGYKLPTTVYGHGFITLNGQKISKSLGNIIRPTDLVKDFGVDGVRYYFIKFGPWIEDVDISLDKLKEAYNADLANGLGNLIARVAKLCENANYTQMGSGDRSSTHLLQIEDYANALNEFRFNDALSFIWKKIADLDKYINQEKPWALQKTGDNRLKAVLAHAVDQIQEIAVLLEPFLPETAKKIEEQFKGPEIKSQQPLFPRI